MGTTAWGFWLIIGVGLVLLVVAALVDRRDRIRKTHARPGVDDTQDAPEYVLEDELAAGRLPPLPTAVIAQENDAPHLALRLLDSRLATYTGGNSVVYDAAVLVLTHAAISDIREVIRVLQRAAAAHTPLILAASTVSTAVHETLVANHLAGKLTLQVLCDGSEEETELAALAALSNAIPITREDLIADALPPEVYGHLALSVATADPPRVWVVRANPTPIPNTD
ncbi:MAG: hypothetical protein LBC29_04345 [Propionibacteriaceae bacterium]|jgi:hypothetical protein|nr:hypothetical protein [Propionibacteriaceae bacterium]